MIIITAETVKYINKIFLIIIEILISNVKYIFDEIARFLGYVIIFVTITSFAIEEIGIEPYIEKIEGILWAIIIITFFILLIHIMSNLKGIKQKATNATNKLKEETND